MNDMKNRQAYCMFHEQWADAKWNGESWETECCEEEIRPEETREKPKGRT